MNEPYDSQTANPSIEKYVVASNNGIETHKFTRCVIGYILHGEKYVYYDDKCYKFSQGDLFFLGMGCHYTKNIPEEGHPYEQILVRFTPEELQRILLHLNITYKLNITNNHLCEKCRTLNHAAMPAWSSIRRFFNHTNDYLTEDSFLHDPPAENIKITELIYLIVSHGDCCIKSKLLGNVDAARDNLQQTVYASIFSDISVEEIAKRCNRSLTSFKKEFFRIYGTSPHQWLIRQRLIHARLLLISTDKAIAEITIRHDTRDLPQPASRTRRVAADTASRSRRTGNSRFGNGVTSSDPTRKGMLPPLQTVLSRTSGTAWFASGHRREFSGGRTPIRIKSLSLRGIRFPYRPAAFRHDSNEFGSASDLHRPGRAITHTPWNFSIASSLITAGKARPSRASFWSCSGSSYITTCSFTGAYPNTRTPGVRRSSPKPLRYRW